MKLFGIPIRFQLSFPLIIGLLGFGRLPDVVGFVSWLLVATFSILVHELGHAFACQAFGLKPRIVFHGMGGATAWEGPPLSPGRDILVSLAGPLAGFLLGVGAFLMMLGTGFDPPDPTPLDVVLSDLLWINLAWGVMNLLPMLPLDGGRVMHGVLRFFLKPRRALQVACVISLVLAVGAAIGAFSAGMTWGALLAAWFGWSNLQTLRNLPDHEPVALEALLTQAQAALRAGQPQEAVPPLVQINAAAPNLGRALLLMEALLESGRPQAAWVAFGQLHDRLPPHERLELEQTLAFRTAAFERSAQAGEALHQLTQDPRAAHNVACAYARLDRPEDAFTWLERALSSAGDDPAIRRLITHDDDLAPLRARPTWGAWAARHLHASPLEPAP